MLMIGTNLTGLALLGLAAFFLVTQPRPHSTEILTTLTGDPVHGEMVYTAAGCGSCHMADKAEGNAQLVLSGGQRFDSPFGTFLAPNISPDPVHGIGGWTLPQFATAVMDGISPQNEHYFPSMPYNAYGKMLPQDVADLKAYMDTMPASDLASLPHKVGFPFNIRRTLGGWKFLFQSRNYVLTGNLSPQIERGRYIAESLSHCGECHTPRNALGGLKKALWMGGASNLSGQGTIPNITPGKLDWSESDIFAYLTTGFTPEFDSVGGHMAHVVDNMAKLPKDDVRAVVAYLKAVAPVTP
jgi:mono/diheme cytochrome c family protein